MGRIGKPLGGGSRAKGQAVTLSADGWEDNIQTVGVIGATADGTLLVGAAEASKKLWANAGIHYSGQGDGTLTFSCDTPPSEDVTANVLFLGEGDQMVFEIQESTGNWKLLWENASPASEFGAQTIDVPGLSNYNLFMVCFRVSTTSDTRTSSIYYAPTDISTSPNFIAAIGTTTSITLSIRARTVKFMISTSQIDFSLAVASNVGSTAAHLIPVQIFGAKI